MEYRIRCGAELRNVAFDNCVCWLVGNKFQSGIPLKFDTLQIVKMCMTTE